VLTPSARVLWLVLAALTLVWIAWLLQLPPRPSLWLVFATGLPLIALGSFAAAVGARDALGAAAGASQDWRAFVRRTADFHALGIVLLFALGVQMQDAHGVTTDGVIYFTQLRSVIFDRDLAVAREFAFLQQPPRPAHIVPIGPTPVWLPLYLAVAAADAIGRAAGWWPAPADPVAIGLTIPYIRAALLSSFAFGAAGLVVVHQLLRREFERAAAFAATLLLLGGTSLFWYLVYEPSMTHAASFGVVAFFVAATARTFEYAETAIKGTVPISAESASGIGHDGAASARGVRMGGSSAADSAEIAETGAVTFSAKPAIFLGMLLGLAFITRPQEAVFALLPAMFIIALPAPAIERIKIAGRYALWGFVGFAPFLLLQLAHSYVLFSRERLVLIGGDEGFLNPLNSRWSETLWSSWHGFLSWTPVAYIALIGTIAYGRRKWPWATAAVLIVFLMAWINGATPDLGAGWSFGGRRFVSCLVLLAPGLALIAHTLIARPMASIALVAGAVLGWNYLLMAQYRSGALAKAEPMSFADIVKQQAEAATEPPFFYPFAFPANALFAWRTGLPIDRYDLLAPETANAEIDLRLEDNAGRFLLDGWGSPAGDQFGSAWWMTTSPATLVLPLKLADERPVRVEIQARSRLMEPARHARVTLLVNDRVAGSFVADAHQASTAVLSTPREMWLEGFNRLTFAIDEPFLPVAIYKIAVRSE
jgi:hypothetical protein